jgi:hypothetical protein
MCHYIYIYMYYICIYMYIYMIIYVYIYILSESKQSLDVFLRFCADVFSTCLSSFFIRFRLPFFRHFLCAFFAFFTLAGQDWEAAELRSSGGLQAGASELALPLPQRFFCVFVYVFLYVFYYSKARSMFWGNIPPPGGGVEG